jgi:hypothetical protein
MEYMTQQKGSERQNQRRMGHTQPDQGTLVSDRADMGHMSLCRCQLRRALLDTRHTQSVLSLVGTVRVHMAHSRTVRLRSVQYRLDMVCM